MTELDKIFRDAIEEMQRYPKGTTLGEMLEISVRRGEPWAIDSLIHDAKRNRFHIAVWANLLDTAARLHPDWYVRDGVEGLNKYRPHRRAKEQTRKQVAAWYVLQDPESALRIKNAWRMEADA